MTEYEQTLAARAALQKAVESGAVEDLSGELEAGVGEDALRRQRLQQDGAALGAGGGQPQQGSVSQAGDLALTGGAASGNPYVIGGAAALKTVGMIDDAKRNSEQAKIDAYNKKIMAQRSAIRNFFE